jgi:hypothetical protein
MMAQIMFELVVALVVVTLFITAIIVMSVHVIRAGDFAEGSLQLNSSFGSYAGVFSR